MKGNRGDKGEDVREEEKNIILGRYEELERQKVICRSMKQIWYKVINSKLA